MTSPMQRALAECKANGWPYAIQEHWNPQAFIRQDLWGIGDLLVLDDEPGALIVQVCAGSSHAARATKARQAVAGIVIGAASKLTRAAVERKAKALQKWLAKGNRVAVWSFSKLGPRNKRKLWAIRRECIDWQPGLATAQILLDGLGSHD